VSFGTVRTCLSRSRSAGMTFARELPDSLVTRWCASTRVYLRALVRICVTPHLLNEEPISQRVAVFLSRLYNLK
jgi:hypothetical protein